MIVATVSGGRLRLVSNGYSNYPSSGRLEIYFYNYGYSWMPFCNQYFNNYDADLACKKLGFVRASHYGRVGNLG